MVFLYIPIIDGQATLSMTLIAIAKIDILIVFIMIFIIFYFYLAKTLGALVLRFLYVLPLRSGCIV